MPDIVGDSLYLSRMAAQTDKDIIVFCGVEFMAETASSFNPEKMVLLPAEAGCSLAASITAEDVQRLKAYRRARRHLRQHLCRRQGRIRHLLHSGNAVEVVNSFDSDTIIFLPDEYLAKNVAERTNASSSPRACPTSSWQRPGRTSR